MAAVYRNARYESRLVAAEANISELAHELGKALNMIEHLARAMTNEHQIPALPETPRAFGRGH
jgi:hypothetical protein